jgi:NAD(FAD)-utilizing enzyme possibly involved in translation
VYIAGQLNGMEGYNAAIASGMYCGINLAKACKGEELYTPEDGIFKAMVDYVTDESIKEFKPLQLNLGLLKR